MPPSADSGANEGSDGMNRKRICTACVWLAALALAACARHEPPADTVRPVQLVQVSVGVLGNPTIYAGEVKPRREVDLGFRIGGKLVARAGEAVMRLGRESEPGVAISVPEDRLGEFKGAKAIGIALWANPSKLYRGSVREIAPAVDPVTRTFAVRVSILDADAALRW